MPRPNQTQYKFQEVAQPQRSATFYKRVPEHTVRLRPSGITIARDVVERFSVENSAGPTQRLHIKIEIDKNNKAIRLTQDEVGYSFQVWPNGYATLSTLPTGIKAAQLPLGEYKTNNQNNVFKFAE